MKRKKTRLPARTIEDLLAMAQQHAERGELAEAEDRYVDALAIDPEHLGALSLLGLLLVEREQIDGAIHLLERARDLAPGFPPVQLALGSAYAAAGHDELAIVAMETAIKLDTTSTVPLERLAKHHIIARRPREAIGLLRRILRRDPAHEHARFLLAGLTGDQRDPRTTAHAHGADANAASTVPSAPSALIADLFDTYAANFDQHLVEKLHYGVPKALAALVAATGAVPDGTWRVVDLGCGTGLAGVEFRAYARTLVGSDLSPRMIARARQRGIFDELHVEELGATLARERDVDLIVAADVFIYVGMLEATFAACASALRPGGRLAFSVETSTGDDVVLLPTLRYAQSEAYVVGLARKHGFVIERSEPTVLRVEDDQPMHGLLYVLRR